MQIRPRLPMRMRTAILYPYVSFGGRSMCCISFHARNAAMFSAIYTMNISVLVILVYWWRMKVNAEHEIDSHDVYLGVQFAYSAIVGIQLFNICLAGLLMYSIIKENCNIITLWVFGIIAFTSMEVVCTVYSNILRDHVNKKFDTWSKEEAAFLIFRIISNILPITGVLKYYYLLRSGVTWKGPEYQEL